MSVGRVDDRAARGESGMVGEGLPWKVVVGGGMGVKCYPLSLSYCAN